MKYRTLLIITTFLAASPAWARIPPPQSNPPTNNPRPSNPTQTNVRPVNTRPVNPRPSNVAPVNTRPVNTRPVNTAPSNPAPVNPRPDNPTQVNSPPSNPPPFNPRPDNPTQINAAPVNTPPVNTKPNNPPTLNPKPYNPPTYNPAQNPDQLSPPVTSRGGGEGSTPTSRFEQNGGGAGGGTKNFNPPGYRTSPAEQPANIAPENTVAPAAPMEDTLPAPRGPQPFSPPEAPPAPENQIVVPEPPAFNPPQINQGNDNLLQD